MSYEASSINLMDHMECRDSIYEKKREISNKLQLAFNSRLLSKKKTMALYNAIDNLNEV